MNDNKIAEIRAPHDAADEDRLETIWRAGLAMRGAVQEIKGLRVEVEKLAQERDEARSKETDYGEGFEEGWIAAQKGAAAEVERLQAALRWYADHRNHFPVLHHRGAGHPDPVAVFVEEPPIMTDGGRRAREALEAKP